MRRDIFLYNRSTQTTARKPVGTVDMDGTIDYTAKKPETKTVGPVSDMVPTDINLYRSAS